jgi:hypothetical protein
MPLNDEWMTINRCRRCPHQHTRMLLRLLHLAHLFAPAHPHVEFNRRVMRELDVCAAAAVSGTVALRWAETSQSNQHRPHSKH